MLRPLLAALILATVANAGLAAEGDAKLAGQAQAFLKKYCYQCHGKNFEIEGLDVLNHKALLDNKQERWVVPGTPDKSALWKQTGIRKRMPKKGYSPQPSDEERDVLRQWIAAGAPPFPDAPAAARAYKGRREVLSAIRDFLRSEEIAPEDYRFQRFFTLTNLANNPAITDRSLRFTRAALSKALNSLSWENEIVVPKAVDREGTIFAVDLRDLGWDSGDRWQTLLNAYPYGLSHEHDVEPALRTLFKDVTEATASDLPYVRADWFVNTALRPELYHALLRLPDNAHDLEKTLKVDVRANFQRNKLARAGFPKSNISSQNRMVERHRSAYGAYWKSYDFKPRNSQSDVNQYPLGPAFKENPFRRQAFVHDGGELIFNLPNGLQGYFLVDKNDKRINEGPTDVVGDPTRISGSTVVVNGLSCVVCHSKGMKPCKDAVREGAGVEGDALLKVLRLYPDSKKLDALLRDDEDRFQKAAEKATASFVKIAEDKDAGFRQLDEPVGGVVDQYQKDLGLPEAACELDVRDVKELQAAVKVSEALRSLGLAPLAGNGTIKREKWEEVKGTSVFQTAAQKLRKGTPVRPVGR